MNNYFMLGLDKKTAPHFCGAVYPPFLLGKGWG